jgi:4-amino-4-deoxy-L-arabinose transferase-like glycosyltransferase
MLTPPLRALAASMALVAEAARVRRCQVAAGQQGHGAPPGFYLTAFWFTFWPAAGLALIAASWAWKNQNEPAVLFCLAWIVPTWIVFEFVVTKLPHYVLPVYPAIAILIALALLAGRQPGPVLATVLVAGGHCT